MTNFRARPQVLLVEDNDYFAQVLVDIFNIMECDVTAVRDAQSALEKLTAIQPHTVFCDITLPGDMDGFAFAAKVRANPALSTVQLVAISGHDAMARHGRGSGFDHFLCKPVKFATLKTLIFDAGACSQAA